MASRLAGAPATFTGSHFDGPLPATEATAGSFQLAAQFSAAFTINDIPPPHQFRSVTAYRMN